MKFLSLVLLVASLQSANIAKADEYVNTSNLQQQMRGSPVRPNEGTRNLCPGPLCPQNPRLNYQAQSDGCSESDAGRVSEANAEKLAHPEYVDPMYEIILSANDEQARSLANIYKAKTRVSIASIQKSAKNIRASLEKDDRLAACYLLSSIEKEVFSLDEFASDLIHLNHPGLRCIKIEGSDASITTHFVLYGNALAQVCGATFGRQGFFYRVKEGNKKNMLWVVGLAESAAEKISKGLETYTVRGEK